MRASRAASNGLVMGERLGARPAPCSAPLCPRQARERELGERCACAEGAGGA
jgi:hypothetical protein